MGATPIIQIEPEAHMYEHNPARKAAALLIACDPNRTVLKLIEASIVTNHTQRSNAELANWILLAYIARTKNHIQKVQICGSYLNPLLAESDALAIFNRNLPNHDFDKFSGNEHTAIYAIDFVHKAYPQLADFRESMLQAFTDIEQPKHHQLNEHHPEHYVQPVDGKLILSDTLLDNYFADKGGRPALLAALAEMVADWMAVGIELGNTAKQWWNDNQGVTWVYGPVYRQFIETCLNYEPSQLYIEQLEPIPTAPKLADTTESVLEGYSAPGSNLTLSDEEKPKDYRGFFEHSDVRDGMEDLASEPENVLSQEATTSKVPISVKKKKILDYICKLCDTMEPSGFNSQRYRELIGKMSDREFDQFIQYMKAGKWQLNLVAPNMKIALKNEDLLKACDLIGLKLFHRVWMHDAITGKKYLTDNEYMFVRLPIRRQQQFLDEKLSVPDDDKKLDLLSGQVTGDSRSCSITNPEIQILAARGLNQTLQELVNVRGGNIYGYNELRRMMEETGDADLEVLDPNSKTRVSVVGKVLLQAMMLDTNL